MKINTNHFQKHHKLSDYISKNWERYLINLETVDHQWLEYRQSMLEDSS